MDIVWIVQGLIAIVLTVGAWMFRDVKMTAEKTKDEFLAYKTHVAERYVSSDQLTKTIDNLYKTLDNVAGAVSRIETRLNNQADNRH